MKKTGRRIGDRSVKLFDNGLPAVAGIPYTLSLAVNVSLQVQYKSVSFLLFPIFWFFDIFQLALW